MSIKQRMVSYELLRATNTTDSYGTMSATPAKITDIEVAVSRNQPTHDTTNPQYATTEYVGITSYVGVVEGDILKNGGVQYRVKDIGDKLTQYLALFLEKL